MNSTHHPLPWRDVLRHGLLSEAQAARFAIQLADILDAAHAHHLVHRDVKPANILLDASGELHLTDFGISVSLDELRRDSQAMTGTPA